MCITACAVNVQCVCIRGDLQDGARCTHPFPHAVAAALHPLGESPRPVARPVARPPTTPSWPFHKTLPLPTPSRQVRFREHTFLANDNVPAALREGTLTLTLAAAGVAPAPSASRSRLELPHGTPLVAVKALVLRHNHAVRVIKVSNAHLRGLCRWLGSAAENAAFNKLIKCSLACRALELPAFTNMCTLLRLPLSRSSLLRYILTESSRYCPEEDHGNYGGLSGGWSWQNPFTAYNCTWGFPPPQLFPADDSGCARASVELIERDNSTTCPRQMLCDWNTREDGTDTKPITWCNIEGYK